MDFERPERDPLPEQPAGRFETPTARLAFVLLGTLAVLAGVLQYFFAMEVLAAGGYGRSDLGPVFGNAVRSTFFAYFLAFALIASGGLATFAGLSRARVRSWRVLGIAALWLGVWLGLMWLIPPQLTVEKLIPLTLLLVPFPIAVIWIAVRGRRTMFR